MGWFLAGSMFALVPFMVAAGSLGFLLDFLPNNILTLYLGLLAIIVLVVVCAIGFLVCLVRLICLKESRW
jgi:hypothetical protein